MQEPFAAALHALHHPDSKCRSQAERFCAGHPVQSSQQTGTAHSASLYLSDGTYCSQDSTAVHQTPVLSTMCALFHFEKGDRRAEPCYAVHCHVYTLGNVL